MTIKDRIELLMQKQGLPDYYTLHYKIRRMLGDEDPRSSAEKKKGNFSKFVNGEREFPKAYIIPLEKILKTSFVYIMEGDDDFFVKGLNNYHFEYIAAKNDYKEFVNLAKNVVPIIWHYDEYDKSIFDYIISYGAIEGIRFFVNELDLRYNAKYGQMELLCKTEKGDEFIPSLNDSKMLEIARLLAKNDESDLFVQLFDGFELTKLSFFSGKTIFERDEFFEIILQSERVLESLKDKRMLSINDINIGMRGDYSFKEMLFTNPLLTPLLYRLVERGDKVDVLVSLLDFAIKENETVLADIAIKQNSGQFKNLHMDEEQTGFILDGYFKIGNLTIYNLPIDPALPCDVKKRLKVLKEQEGQINNSDRFLLNEQGKTAFRIKDGKMLVNHVSNETMYTMYRDMNNAKISAILEFIGEKDGTDSFVFDEEGCAIVSRLSHEQIISTVHALKVLHQAMLKKYGDTIIVHGDLLNDSLVFEGQELKRIIHWDRCHFGTKEEELVSFIYQLFEPSFRYMETYDQNKKVDTIKDILDEYGDKDLKKEFGNKMIAHVEKWCEKLDDSNKETFMVRYTQLAFVKGFIKANLVELNSL